MDENVLSRKVQLVTSKLDQAHGKAREIEAIVIASIAFDNRFCHALTLNRLVAIGSLFTYLGENLIKKPLMNASFEQGLGGVWLDGGAGDVQHGEERRGWVQSRARRPLWLETASADRRLASRTQAGEEPRASLDYFCEQFGERDSLRQGGVNPPGVQLATIMELSNWVS